MKKNLSKLSKVELREVWGHEAIDFTNWLAQEENLDLLSEEIGVDIKLIRTEANVWRFSVDILAEEESSGKKIIIENQLEDTDHDHLGKIITYASWYDAEIVVWIVRDFRDEHKRAIDWLNEHTDEKINFFLIKLELWQIENSNPAPKFDIIVSPNEWAKTIKTSVANGELSDTKVQQLDFWTKFKDYVRSNYPKSHFGRTPRPQHWYNINIGSSIAHVALTINTQKNTLWCEVYINKDKELFNFLQEKKSEIEKEIGDELEWVDASVASRIVLKTHVSDIFTQNETQNHFKWLYEKTVLFQKVFWKYLKEFKK